MRVCAQALLLSTPKKKKNIHVLYINLSTSQVPNGALVYALSTQLEANNASFWAAPDSPSMLAVQMTDGSSMKALGCSFRGWEGPYVVLTGGQLEMDACDFRGR